METLWNFTSESIFLNTQVNNCILIDLPSCLLFPSPCRFPYCPAIEYSLTDGIHTLSCASYNTPPTQVIWEKDGERIHSNDTSHGTYTPNQVLLNRTTSAYNNTLTINATIEDVIGEYSCTVLNSVGSSDELTKAVKGDYSTSHVPKSRIQIGKNCSPVLFR